MCETDCEIAWKIRPYEHSLDSEPVNYSPSALSEDPAFTHLELLSVHFRFYWSLLSHWGMKM